jgi:hypothetical protein
MGISRDKAAELAHLMDEKNQLVYGRPKHEEVTPPPKIDRLEREEQRQFASWILLKNSCGLKIPFVWHSTAHRSKATPGTPDFLVGVNRSWLCFEFKRDYSQALRPAQQEFCDACVAQGLPYYLVYSAQEAIKIVEGFLGA